jgi:hypothetical protein
MGNDYPLLYQQNDENSFLDVIKKTLDDKQLYNLAINKIKPIVKKMDWNKQVKSWMDWDELFNPNTFPMVGEDTSTYKKVLALIKKHKRVSKKQLIGELNWGKQFKFGRYRNRLRLDKRIRFTNDGYIWLE